MSEVWPFLYARSWVSTTTACEQPGSRSARSSGTESVVPPSSSSLPSTFTMRDTTGRLAEART